MNRPDNATVFGFIVVVILLGANFVAVRFSNAELAPFWGAALRFGTASIILGLLMLVNRKKLPAAQELKAAVIFGGLSFGVSYALIYWALLSVTSSMTAVIFSTLPLATLLIAAAVGVEQLNRRNVVGALIAIAGITLVFSERIQADVPVAGLLAVVAAVVVSAFATVVVKRLPKPDPVSLNAIGMAVGTIILLGGSLLFKETWSLPSIAATWTALGWLIGSTIAAFLLFVWIVGRWTASAATYALVLAPIVTVIVGVWLANELLTARTLLGSVVVLAGTYLGSQRKN